MEVFTTLPAVQFYTANSISKITGKNGAVYKKYGAFCLETQQFPDAVNKVNDFMYCTVNHISINLCHCLLTPGPSKRLM